MRCLIVALSVPVCGLIGDESSELCTCNGYLYPCETWTHQWEYRPLSLGAPFVLRSRFAGKSRTRIKACLLTISDRASQGVYEDLSGPAMREFLESKARKYSVATSLPCACFSPMCEIVGRDARPPPLTLRHSSPLGYCSENIRGTGWALFLGLVPLPRVVSGMCCRLSVPLVFDC